MVWVGQWTMADPGLFGTGNTLKPSGCWRRLLEVNVFEAQLHVTLEMNTPDIIRTSQMASWWGAWHRGATHTDICWLLSWSATSTAFGMPEDPHHWHVFSHAPAPPNHQCLFWNLLSVPFAAEVHSHNHAHYNVRMRMDRTHAHTPGYIYIYT